MLKKLILVSILIFSIPHNKSMKILVNPRGFENVYSPYTFLKAINNIKNKICNLQFVIIGDGPEKVNIDKYILKNNLKGLITVKVN